MERLKSRGRHARRFLFTIGAGVSVFYFRQNETEKSGGGAGGLGRSKVLSLVAGKYEVGDGGWNRRREAARRGEWRSRVCFSFNSGVEGMLDGGDGFNPDPTNFKKEKCTFAPYTLQNVAQKHPNSSNQ